MLHDDTGKLIMIVIILVILFVFGIGFIMGHFIRF